MILTCPECATSYFVDAGRVPPEGRTVRCSSCGAKWRAFPEAEVAVEAPPTPLESTPATEPEPILAEVIEDAAPEPESVAAEDVEIVAEPRPEPHLRPRPARPFHQPVARRETAVAGAIAWAAAAGIVTVVLVGAVVFRHQLVRLVPASAPVFAGLGLPADRLGLVIDDVKFQPTFQAGRPVLSVTGAIRNTRDAAVHAPALRVSLLDEAGKPLAAKIARPLNAEIPAHAKRYFAIAIADPPAGSETLDVAFEASATAHAEQAVEAVLGPEPIEAKPLVEEPQGAPADHG